MFEDDQQTPTPERRHIFETPGGKRKMMGDRSPSLDHEHEAEIGTGAYGASSRSSRGSYRDGPTQKKPAEKNP